MFRFLRPLAAAAIFGLFMLSAPVQAAGSITFFAAASLKDALDAAAAAYKATNGTEFHISYASSLTLAKQIEQGAPADLFASADLDSMDYLAARHLINPASRFNLLGNRLVVVAPKDSLLQTLAFTPAAFAAAIGSGHVATGDIASVPVGKYAQASLQKLGLWDDVQPHLALTADVRSALTFVARGEAVLGFVYATDAAAEPNVKIVARFPEDSHPPIVYPFALTADSNNTDAAKFLDFLKSAAARSYFEAQGFTVLE